MTFRVGYKRGGDGGGGRGECRFKMSIERFRYGVRMICRFKMEVQGPHHGDSGSERQRWGEERNRNQKTVCGEKLRVRPMVLLGGRTGDRSSFEASPVVRYFRLL